MCKFCERIVVDLGGVLDAVRYRENFIMPD